MYIYTPLSIGILSGGREDRIYALISYCILVPGSILLVYIFYGDHRSRRELAGLVKNQTVVYYGGLFWGLCFPPLA